ncbi:unnamed protein product [Spirodela intermedia]|uniref:Uncharacterized protein n=1 Tax=Spirodela intermedia TaxID=51605 RepID=A0A7I8JKA3_SPIIN|nr:unnamed protein product [Spirodela intermedia]CAA6670023.1 unnamed protein product [Spirodela intermedia]
MGHQIIFDGCHSVERKNGDFAALRQLSPDEEELDGGGAYEVATYLPTDRPLPDDDFGAHMPPSIQATQAPTRDYSPTTLPTHL